MKYINTFKIFEKAVARRRWRYIEEDPNDRFLTQEQVDTIHDIFLEFSDHQVHYSIKSAATKIKVNLYIIDLPQIDITDEVIGTLQHLNDYLDSVGLENRYEIDRHVVSNDLSDLKIGSNESICISIFV
jgi:hypothetical protein